MFCEQLLENYASNITMNFRIFFLATFEMIGIIFVNKRKNIRYWERNEYKFQVMKISFLITNN
jgi:hypothetical protein